MLTTFSKFVRPVVVVVLMGLPVAPAEAGWWNRPEAKPMQQVTASRRQETGDPVVGTAVIGVGVAIFVFLAWVAVKVGGGNLPADDLPE